MPRPPLLPLVLDKVPQAVRHALVQEGVPFRNRIPGSAHGRFVLFDSLRGPCRWIADGQIAIDVDDFRHRTLDPWATLVDDRARPHRWQVGDVTIEEEISRVNKRAVRERAMGELRARIESLGGVWVRLSPYPFPFRSVLGFRIDYDQYDPAGFEATLDAVSGSEGFTSHFVNGAAFVAQLAALSRLRGLDVGSHGYWHHTYLTEEENLRNIQRGIHVLRQAGIEPSGFVAPHGRFNPSLLAALDKLNVTHSSEFALAYDELPFFPDGGGVLQIPVHPVCQELFVDAVRKNGAAVDPAALERVMAASIAYFEQVARDKYRAGEPMFFYGHSTPLSARQPHVLAALVEAAAGFRALWRATLSEFGAWWRVRAGVRLSVAREQDEYTITTDHIPTDYPVGIEYCRGRKVALMPLDRQRLRFSPAALAYETRSWQPAFRPVRVDGPQGIRAHLRRFLDWERVTPVEEIMPNNWRNWAKRALRRWG